MAKQTDGLLGGFNGRIGNIVGYRWKGVWCVRTRPGQMHNPKTKKQMEHREMFKEEVRQASHMALALNLGLRQLAEEANMTAHNVFVSLNQQAFSLVDGVFTVDYPTLRLSAGPAAPVAFGTPEVREGNTLSISFEKNPLHSSVANAFDYVYLYAYCPDERMGFLTAPVHRRDRLISVSLPDRFAGRELQLYGMVQNRQGLMSETIYAGCIILAESVESQGIPDNEENLDNLEVLDNLEGLGNVENPEVLDNPAKPSAAPEGRQAAPAQPTLFDIGDL